MFYTKPTDLNFSPDNFYKEPVAPANPSSLSDIYGTAKTDEHTNQQLLSSYWNLADVYDEHNKKVKALTGVDLVSPATMYSPSDGRDEERKRYYADFAKYKEEGGSLNQLGFLKNWREQDYRRQLEELAAKHPDKRGELLPERSFIDQSFGKRGETEKKAETTWENSNKGMLDWGAWLSGKVAAGLTDPINVITAPVGFGAVGTGAKGLAMGFIKNGGVNAMVEVGQQPFIQGQRSDAGQSHGIAQGAENVAGAFLFGGALDTAVRGTARALRYSFGYEPVTRDGVVVGYRRKTDAPAGGEVAPVPEISPDLIERAGRNDRAAMDEIERILSKDKSYIPAETVAKADAGDARAIRDVAERTGLADDPAMRHALDAMDANERIAEPPTKTIAKGDHDAAITQGIRHAADPELEPMPVVRENVSPSKIHDMQGDILDLQAEIRRIGDELDADPNAHPPTVLADMRMKLAEVVEAHEAARRQVFADDVIEMVDAGKAPQDLADIVANHVDDKSLQGKLLTDLIARKPESPLEARNQIAELLASPDYKPQPLDTDVAPVGLKTRALDDPYGPDAVKQTQALEASMAEELGRKTAPPPTPEEVGAKIKEVIDRGEQVRAAIAEVSGIVPAGVEVKVFSSVADLPDAIRGQVEMANAKAFAVAMQRFQSAKSEVAREAARRMKDDAKMGRGIEGIAQDGTIWIASFAMDPKGRVAHEVVHALRTMGQIAPDEVRVLAAYARETGAFDGAKEKLYRTELEGRGYSEAKVADLLDEEAAAHAIEGASRQTDTPTPIKSITDRIAEFFERVRSALRRQGFMTAEEKATLAAKPANDVIQSFMSGEMMKREGVKAWMRQEDITAYAMRDGLDMSPEARKQRAEAMGFDTSRVWYHGTRHNFEAFDPAAVLAERAKRDPYYAGSPRMVFLSGDDKLPTLFGGGNDGRLIKTYVKRDLNLFDGKADAAKLEAFLTENEPAIRDRMTGPENLPLVDQVRAGNWAVLETPPVQEWLRTNGYDGFRAEQVGFNGTNKPSEILAVFDTANSRGAIRDTAAQFDPAKASSPNLMYAFAGERARTADLEALNRAKVMASKGDDRTLIWNETGWFQGVDGKWRFEIDDSGSAYAGKSWRGGARGDKFLPDVLSHDKLYDAYPDLKDAGAGWEINRNAQIGDELGGVYFSPGNVPPHMPFVEGFGYRGTDKGMIRDGMLHEGQHALQYREGFAYGTSPEAAGSMDAYKRSAGEVEARAVQKRMDLTADERRARPPWLDYDVPESQQIVRGMSEPMFAMVDTNVGREMKRDLDKLGYFSGALEAAKRLKQAKGTPEQMLAQLKAAGAKAGEIEATGLAEFLEGRPSVTRDEIVRHLEGNRLGLNEVKYGGVDASPDTLDHIDATIKEMRDTAEIRGGQLGVELRRAADQIERQRQRDPMEFDNEAFWEGLTNNEDVAAAISAAQDNALEARSRPKPADAKAKAKWSSHSLDPSNPSYRETVLHLPESNAPTFEQYLKSRQDKGTAYADPEPEMLARYRAEYDAGAWRNTGNYSNIGGSQDTTFRSGHFPEPNIVGHMMTSMTKHEGKPVYTIDQIQSDWGQKLRDGGVRDEAKIAELKNKLDAAKVAEEKLKPAFADRGQELEVLAGLENYGGNLERMKAEKYSNGKPVHPLSALLTNEYVKAMQDRKLLWAELNTAEASTPGHPLVNTTDQWTNTTLRRAIRQAAEADAEFIAIPSGDTVLSYNPGDTAGMHGFYGRTAARHEVSIGDNLEANPSEVSRAPIEGIVPKNLRKLLSGIDKESPKPITVDQLETPTSGMKGRGFTLFPLTEKVKQSVKEDGLPLFAMRSEDQSFAADAIRAYHGTPGAIIGKFQGGRDIGPHFGSTEQANGIAQIRGVDRGLPAAVYPVDINAKTILELGTETSYSANASDILRQMNSNYIFDRIPEAQIIAKMREIENLPPAEANQNVRAFLVDHGYDAISYKSPLDGPGTAYIPLREGSVRSATSGDVLYAMRDEQPDLTPERISQLVQPYLDAYPNITRMVQEELGRLGSTESTAPGGASAITVPPTDPAKYIKTSDYERALLAPYADGASSRQVPFSGELPPVGSWRMSDRKGLYGRDIEHLQTFKPEDLLLPEVREGKLDPTKRGDDARYADWIKEGKRPPPIEVLQMDDGRFRVMDGHRRALAAQQAGQPIDAWVSYSVPTGKLDSNGNPMKTSLTYELAQSSGERISGKSGTGESLNQNFTSIAESIDLPSLVTRLMEDAPALAEARTALSSVVGDEAAQNIELAVLRALVTGESPVDLDALSGIARQVMDQFAPQQPRASEPMFAMRDEEGRMKLGARERAQQLQDDLAAIEAQFQVAGGDERLKLQAKRAALLSAQAFEKVIDDTGLYRDGLGRGDRARALMALIETHGENEMVPFADLVSSKKNIENHALGMVEGMLWEWRKGAVSGDLRRKFNSSVKANMENVIREASGVSTNDGTAKVFAKAWLDATEYLRQRFNAAGGDIGKLAGWFMPQFHDADALIKVTREGWVNRLMTDGVLAREKIIDYETNAPMTDAKLRPMLREIWLAITSDGASRMEIGDAPAGKGALYKRHMEHRVLHFKDADQWMKYNRDFGGGDIYSAMIGHVNMMARDIALMERFGPNPERTMQRVKATILNEAKMQQPAKSMFDDFKEQIEALKASLKTLPSEVDTITAAIGDVHAKIDAIRVENPGKRARRRAEGKIEELRQQLGPLHQRLDKAVETNNPTPQQRVMIDKIQAAAEEMAFAEQYLVTSRNPTERTNRILARADEMMKVYNGTTNTPIDSKFAGAMVGIRNTISASSLVYAPFSAVTDQATQLAARSFIGMPATSQLSSFVNGFTQGDRRLALEVGLGLDQVAAAFAQQARFVGGYNARHITGYITDRSHAYSLLSPMTQASKVGFGLDFMRWMAGMKDTAFKDLGEETTRMMTKHGFTADDWAAIKAAKPEKGLLTRNAVAQAAGDDVAEKYMRMLYRERGQAVLEGTIQGRTAFISDTQPGTVTGELLRSAAMLKSFPTSYMMLILGRLYNETMAGRGLKASTIGYGASIFIVGTMLGALAKQMKNVGQGRDPEDMTKAKFWAESFMQSGGAGIFGDFIGSSVNRMGSGLAGTIMGPVADRGGTLLDLTFGNVAQYAKDEKTNAGRESVKMIRGMTPGMFAPWYIRLAYERLLLDELQKKVDPEYYKSFESKVRAQKKRSGNDFYFAPGGSPRAPNFGAAFGQQ